MRAKPMEIQTQPQTPGDCFWLCPCTKWSQVPLNYWNSRLCQHTAIFNSGVARGAEGASAPGRQGWGAPK